MTRKATRPFLIINATNLYQGARFEFADDNIPLDSPASGIKGRKYYNELPTTLYLPDDQVDNLITVGGWLLNENPDFKHFLSDY